MVDVLEEFISSSHDILKGWHLFNVDRLWFLLWTPQVEVVLVFFQGLHLLDWWALPFPSLLNQILTLGQVQKSSQTAVKVLDDAVILLLDC